MRFCIAILVFCLLAGCNASPAETLSEDEQLYLRTEEALVDAVEREGAEAGITLLKRHMDENAHLASLCHPLAHAVGRSAYVRYGFSGAVSFRDDVCGTGYLHGIVESHFIGLPDPEVAAKILCEPNAADCFHGVGHGLMLALFNDVPASVAICRTLEQRFQRIQCAEGVYMELFQIEDASHEAVSFGTGDSLTPCEQVEDPYRATCAFYAPRHFLKIHEGDKQGAVALCQRIGRPTQDACIKGLGSAAMKNAIDDPLSVQRLCLSLEEPDRGYCVEGMTSYWIVHFASATKGKQLCGMLEESQFQRCMRIVRESEKFYD